MRPDQRLAVWLQDRGTRLFSRIYHAPVERTTEVVAYGDSIKAYVFSDNSPMFGQNTPFNTVLLNNQLLSQLSETAKQVVIHHEASHQRRGPFFRGVWGGMVIIGVIGIVGLLMSALYWALGVPLNAVMVIGGVSLLFLGLGIVTNRVEETLADLQTLHQLGEDAFLRGYQEIDSVAEETLLTRVLGALFYTHPRNTVRLYRALRGIGIVDREPTA